MKKQRHNVILNLIDKYDIGTQEDLCAMLLEAGYDEKELLSLLEGLQVVSIGAMQNIERQGADYDVFMKEMKRACELGEKIGTKMIRTR